MSVKRILGLAPSVSRLVWEGQHPPPPKEIVWDSIGMFGAPDVITPGGVAADIKTIKTGRFKSHR